MSDFQSTVSRALSLLSDRQRAGYAGDVIRGDQRWSGSDLKGKARRYGARYARQREASNIAWVSCGGSFAYLRKGGDLISVVQVGQDDYGRAILQTRNRGLLIASVHTR